AMVPKDLRRWGSPNRGEKAGVGSETSVRRRGALGRLISDVRASTPGSRCGGGRVPKEKSVAHVGHQASHPAEQKEVPLAFDPFAESSARSRRSRERGCRTRL